MCHGCVRWLSATRSTRVKFATRAWRSRVHTVRTRAADTRSAARRYPRATAGAAADGRTTGTRRSIATTGAAAMSLLTATRTAGVKFGSRTAGARRAIIVNNTAAVSLLTATRTAAVKFGTRAAGARARRAIIANDTTAMSLLAATRPAAVKFGTRRAARTRARVVRARDTRSTPRTTTNCRTTGRTRRTVGATLDPAPSVSRAGSTSAATTMVRSMQVRPAPRPTMLTAAVRATSSLTATSLPATVIRRAGSARFSHASARENTRPLSGRNARLTAIDRRAQVVIAESHVLVIALHRSETNMAIVICNQLVRARPRVQAAFTTVVAHTVHRDVVDHRPVVNIGDVSFAQVCNRPVVVERPMAPVTALEANTGVAVPVIDTTVKTYVRAPIAGVPHIRTATPAPVARRP